MSLVVITAVPAAVMVVPDTMPYVVARAVSDLRLPADQAAGMVRAAGLALPALLPAVPLAAVLARRMPAVVLIAGLGAVLCGEAAAELAGRLTVLGPVPAVGVSRVVEGLGAGAVLPATLVLARRHDGPRGRALTALWAGALTAALIAAMPFALYGLAAAGEWRAALQPYPWFAALALGVAALFGPLPARAAAPAVRRIERTQLLLPLAPAAGFAFLAVVTTYGWTPGAQLALAGLGAACLAGLAVVGSRDATAGTPLCFALVAFTAGLLGMPVAAPLAGLIGANPGPRGVPLAPFAAAAMAAAAAALIASRSRTGGGRAVLITGHALAVVAVLWLRATDTATDTGMDAAMSGGWSRPWPAAFPLALLGAGLGAALAASLRAASQGGALFGLTMCFPGVLCGYMVIGPLQVHRVGAAMLDGGGTGDVVAALTAAFRVWLVIAGALAALLAAVAAIAGRDRARPVVTAGRDAPADAAAGEAR
ncbi:MAG TPA: hypothetical protein VF069_00150 [Streptosporangiaceae bacterium]